MKTVMIYESFTDPAKFVILEGDYSHLDKTLVNEYIDDPDEREQANRKQDELCGLLFTEEGFEHPVLANALSEFPLELVKTEDDIVVITAGVLP